MAVTGELNDLSLAELIEFFCNQRKTGRLKVAYPHGDGFFYLQSGSVVHASIGVLDGIEAVFYALTLRNASFAFAPGVDAPQQTINQPWISVVLEGLRRMDEGLPPGEAFPKEAPASVEIKPVVEVAQPLQIPPAVVKAPPPVENKPASVAPSVPAKTAAVSVPPAVETKPAIAAAQPIQAKPAAVTAPEIPTKPVVAVPSPVEPKPAVVVAQQLTKEKSKEESVESKPKAEHSSIVVPEKVKQTVEPPGFLAEVETASRFSYTPWKLSMIFAAVLALIAVIAVPWGWYVRGRAAKAVNETATPSVENAIPQSSEPVTTTEPVTESPNDNASPASSSENSDLAKQQREARAREEARRLKAAENAAALSSSSPTAATSPRPAANNPSETSTGKKVTVQVTYDENGRVTQASGGDATALRIARQKRFPAGKAGSATITIPIN